MSVALHQTRHYKLSGQIVFDGSGPFEIQHVGVAADCDDPAVSDRDCLSPWL